MIPDFTIPPLAIVGAAVLTGAAIAVWAWRTANRAIELPGRLTVDRFDWNAAEADKFEQAHASESSASRWK